MKCGYVVYAFGVLCMITLLVGLGLTYHNALSIETGRAGLEFKSDVVCVIGVGGIVGLFHTLFFWGWYETANRVFVVKGVRPSDNPKRGSSGLARFYFIATSVVIILILISGCHGANASYRLGKGSFDDTQTLAMILAGIATLLVISPALVYIDRISDWWMPCLLACFDPGEHGSEAWYTKPKTEPPNPGSANTGRRPDARIAAEAQDLTRRTDEQVPFLSPAGDRERSDAPSKGQPAHGLFEARDTYQLTQRHSRSPPRHRTGRSSKPRSRMDSFRNSVYELLPRRPDNGKHKQIRKKSNGTGYRPGAPSHPSPRMAEPIGSRPGAASTPARQKIEHLRLAVAKLEARIKDMKANL